MVCVIVRNHRDLLDSADQGAGLARDPVHHHGCQALGQGEGDPGDEVGGGHMIKQYVCIRSNVKIN